MPGPGCWVLPLSCPQTTWSLALGTKHHGDDWAAKQFGAAAWSAVGQGNRPGEAFGGQSPGGAMGAVWLQKLGRDWTGEPVRAVHGQ